LLVCGCLHGGPTKFAYESQSNQGRQKGKRKNVLIVFLTKHTCFSSHLYFPVRRSFSGSVGMVTVFCNLAAGFKPLLATDSSDDTDEGALSVNDSGAVQHSRTHIVDADGAFVSASEEDSDNLPPLVEDSTASRRRQRRHTASLRGTQQRLRRWSPYSLCCCASPHSFRFHAKPRF
jgi:hypothetical protein